MGSKKYIKKIKRLIRLIMKTIIVMIIVRTREIENNNKQIRRSRKAKENQQDHAMVIISRIMQ